MINFQLIFAGVFALTTAYAIDLDDDEISFNSPSDYEVPQEIICKLSPEGQKAVFKIYGSVPCCSKSNDFAENLRELLATKKPKILDEAKIDTSLVWAISRMEQWCKAIGKFKDENLELMPKDVLEHYLSNLVKCGDKVRNTMRFRIAKGKIRIIAVCAGTAVVWPKKSESFGFSGFGRDPALWVTFISLGAAAYVVNEGFNAWQGYSGAHTEMDRVVADQLQDYPYMSGYIETDMVKSGCGEQYSTTKDTNYTVVNGTVILYPDTKDVAGSLCSDIKGFIISFMNNQTHARKPTYPVDNHEFHSFFNTCWLRLINNASRYVDNCWHKNCTFLTPIRWDQNPHLPQKGMSVQSVYLEIPDNFPINPSRINLEIVAYNQECYIASELQKDHNTLKDFLLDSHDKTGFNLSWRLASRIASIILFIVPMGYLVLFSC